MVESLLPRAGSILGAGGSAAHRATADAGGAAIRATGGAAGTGRRASWLCTWHDGISTTAGRSAAGLSQPRPAVLPVQPWRRRGPCAACGGRAGPRRQPCSYSAAACAAPRERCLLQPGPGPAEQPSHSAPAAADRRSGSGLLQRRRAVVLAPVPGGSAGSTVSALRPHGNAAVRTAGGCTEQRELWGPPQQRCRPLPGHSATWGADARQLCKWLPRACGIWGAFRVEAEACGRQSIRVRKGREGVIGCGRGLSMEEYCCCFCLRM